MFDNTKKLTKNQKYTQAELFKMVLENEDLREKTEALFALDFKDLTLVKDEYPDYEFNLDGRIWKILKHLKKRWKNQNLKDKSNLKMLMETICRLILNCKRNCRRNWI